MQAGLNMMVEDKPKILVVDDDATAVVVLGRVLSELGMVRFSTTSTNALALAREWLPDVILLDVVMPELGGFELCSIIKEDPLLCDVPIIFVTSKDSTEEEVAGLSLGAVDFISKPLVPQLVVARVRTQIRLKQMSDQLRRAATVDGLTGVANRRRLEESLPREWLRVRRNGGSLVVMMVDIDFFKAYNDLYGHQEGDKCIRQVALAIAGALRRPVDMVARYGGEEFAVMLPDTDLEGGKWVAKQILDSVQALQIPHAASEIAGFVTISIGVSCLETGTSIRNRAPMEMLDAADQALYVAKHKGRAQVWFLELDCLGDPDKAVFWGAL